jgi:SHAQKYF class myb-like DNA-binding protein
MFSAEANKQEDDFMNSNDTITDEEIERGVKNGRWTDQEHVKFLEAIFIYGNEWKKVQNYLKTRTSSQARSHAQKFFLKVRKDLRLDTYFPGVKLSNDINDEKSQQLVNLIYNYLKQLLLEKSPNAEECLTLDKSCKLLRMLFNFCKDREKLLSYKNENKTDFKRKEIKDNIKQLIKRTKSGVLFKVEKDNLK